MNQNQEMNPLHEFLVTATLWQARAVEVILAIPEGYLATYGSIAGHLGDSNAARSVATLRRLLYGRVGHDTHLPLHRICCQGDVFSMRDSEETRRINTQLRTEEGSLENPRWF